MSCAVIVPFEERCSEPRISTVSDPSTSGPVQKVNEAEIVGITAANNANEIRISNASTFDEVDIDVSASGTGEELDEGSGKLGVRITEVTATSEH